MKKSNILRYFFSVLLAVSAVFAFLFFNSSSPNFINRAEALIYCDSAPAVYTGSCGYTYGCGDTCPTWPLRGCHDAGVWEGDNYYTDRWCVNTEPGPCTQTCSAFNSCDLTAFVANNQCCGTEEINDPTSSCYGGGGGAVCGNGTVESGEQCDDGNTVGGDGCSATCQNEGPGGNPPGCNPINNGMTVNLTASPNPGYAPLNTSIRADMPTGVNDYDTLTTWWDCTNDGTWEANYTEDLEDIPEDFFRTFSCSYSSAGTYTARFQGQSVGATTKGPVCDVTTVTVNVPPKPIIDLNPKAFGFSGITNGSIPAAQNMVITNTGDATLNWKWRRVNSTGGTSPVGTWCSLQNSSGSPIAVDTGGSLPANAGSGSSVTTRVAVTAPSNAGSFNDCNIQIYDPEAINNPQTASVVYVVRPTNVSGVVAALAACPSRDIILNWTAAQAGASSITYNVYRNTINSAPALPYASGITTTTWTDSSTVVSNTYYYWVEAESGGVTSTNKVAANGGVGVLVSACAVNSPPTASASISKDGVNYASSITVTQGVATPVYLSAAGSNDPNGWTDATNGVYNSSGPNGGKCEWNSDLNQGAPTYETTVNNPETSANCNLDKWKMDQYDGNPDGLITFNDAPGTYFYSVLRITDKPGATSNVPTVSVTVTAPSVPSCTSAGPDGWVTTQVTGTADFFAYGVQNASWVNFAVWSDINGQDDLVWYTGVDQGGGTWKATVDMANHRPGNPDYGQFLTHVWMGSPNTFCDAANFVRNTLSVTLSANPSSGPVPPSTTLTANPTYSGNPSDSITYSFWTNCPDATTDVAAAEAACGALPPLSSIADGACATNLIGHRCKHVWNDPYDFVTSAYPAGSFTAKVIVEQGSIFAQAQTPVSFTAPPIAPSNLQADNSICSQIRFTWTDNSSDETGFRLYRDTDSDPAGAILITTTAANVQSYTYTPPDTNPYYYFVSSFNGNGESARIAAANNPVASIACQANLSGSDKDITQVQTLSTGAGPLTACNGEFQGSYVGTTPIKFLTGDVVSFRINICNNNFSSEADATSVVVTDYLSNLEKPTAGWSAKICNPSASCADVNPPEGGTAPNQTLTFNVGTVPQGESRYITFNARIAAATGPTSRFNNRAEIDYIKDASGTPGFRPASTPWLPYYSSTGVPVRVEKPPQ